MSIEWKKRMLFHRTSFIRWIHVIWCWHRWIAKKPAWHSYQFMTVSGHTPAQFRSWIEFAGNNSFYFIRNRFSKIWQRVSIRNMKRKCFECEKLWPFLKNYDSNHDSNFVCREFTPKGSIKSAEKKDANVPTFVPKHEHVFMKLPKKGKFNLQSVLDSTYFFSWKCYNFW